MEPRVLNHHLKGTGEPVVLLPGGLTGWLSWVPHQERLAARFRAIRVQPIHNELGSAGHVGDPEYTAVTDRESLRLTLDSLGLERVHLAGWSSGGRSALEFATEYPRRIRSLTLVEPAAYWVLSELGIEAAAVESAAASIDAMFGRHITEEDLASFLVTAGFVSTPDEARKRPEWDRWTRHRMALSWQGGALERPHRRVTELSRVTCPTLLTKGSRGGSLDRRLVDVLGALLPQATVRELDGDHAHHIQSIDAFLAALEAHLDRAASS